MGYPSSAHRSPQCGPREQSYQALAPFPTAPGYSWNFLLAPASIEMGEICALLLLVVVGSLLLHCGSRHRLWTTCMCKVTKKNTSFLQFTSIGLTSIGCVQSRFTSYFLSTKVDESSANSSREFGYSVANDFLNYHLALRFLSLGVNHLGWCHSTCKILRDPVLNETKYEDGYGYNSKLLGTIVDSRSNRLQYLAKTNLVLLHNRGEESQKSKWGINQGRQNGDKCCYVHLFISCEGLLEALFSRHLTNLNTISGPPQGKTKTDRFHHLPGRWWMFKMFISLDCID